MAPRQLATIVKRMPPTGPETERLEASLRLRRAGRDVWYASQKEHWLGWLGEYDGPGYYKGPTGRETRPSSTTTSNALLCFCGSPRARCCRRGSSPPPAAQPLEPLQGGHSSARRFAPYFHGNSCIRRWPAGLRREGGDKGCAR